jgi:hypothetical protein
MIREESDIVFTTCILGLVQEIPNQKSGKTRQLKPGTELTDHVCKVKCDRECKV